MFSRMSRSTKTSSTVPPPSRAMVSARRVSTTDIARPQSCGCRLDDDSTVVWFSSMGQVFRT
ncbi:hypothetical protein ACFFX0_16605 [Citricoccus parietis]|uniref:Uncharacterized protein n=1 Tax=Citricoccus parietis TaxID=592307 RepID=A0ABV5G1F2_9MICC